MTAGDRNVRHFLAKPGEATEFVKQRTAPEPDVGVIGKLVLVGAERQLRIRTMVFEILIDDAILQHASERQSESRRASRPDVSPLQNPRQRRARSQGAARARRFQCARAEVARLDEPDENSGEDQCQQHGDGGAMGRRRDCDQCDQRKALTAVEVSGSQQQEIESEHAEPGKNVREQDRGQPGQGGDRRQTAMMTRTSHGRS